MRKQSKKVHKTVFFGLLIMAVLLAGLHYHSQVLAIFDPDTAIHIDAASIDNSTLIIGTHLIYLGALNDAIYEIALTSAQDSGQHTLYYKSELADGAWFDITDAGSLEDIMGFGMRVEDVDIHALSMTHHTRADGITYDLRTNRKVGIFDIDSAYELEKLPELEPLKMQYDRLKEAQSETEEDQYHQRIISIFFRTTLSYLEETILNIKQEEITKIHTAETDFYDKQMYALQIYYEILKKNGAAAEETDAVLKVMNKLDSSRKAAVYVIIGEALDHLSDKMQGNGETSSDGEEAPIEINDTLLSAVEDSKVKIMDSLREHEGSRMAPGTTVMSNMEYSLEQELVAAALAGRHSTCDMVVVKLISLHHIMNGQIVSKTSELTIAEELIKQMDQVYEKSLQKGADDAYDKAVKAHSSHVILENIINSNTVTCNVLRSELQFYVQAKIDRLENEEAQQYIKDRISSSGKFKIVIPMDAFQNSAKGTVETYVTWLQKLLKSVSEEGNTSELDKLYEEKLALQEEKMTALDKEEIREAKKAEAKIQAKEKEITKIEEAAANQIILLEAQKASLEAKLEIQTDDLPAQTVLMNQIADIQQQIAEAGTNLSDESTAQNIQNMKQEALQLIREGETAGNKLEELGGYIDGIGAFLGAGSALALNAEKEIYQAIITASYLKEQSAYDVFIEQIESKIENSMVNQTGNTETATAALAVIEDVLGTSLTIPTADKSGENTAAGENAAGSGGSKTDGSTTEGAVMVDRDSMNQEDLLTAVSALVQYGEQTDNEEIRSLAAGLTAAMMKEANSGAFEQLHSVNGEFAPASALADYLHYRYLWNDTKKTAVIANGLTYYRFTAFHDTVEKNGEQTETMPVAAEFRATVYIPSDYLYEEFGCQVFNITGTNYAILIDDDIIKKSDELLERLRQP